MDGTGETYAGGGGSLAMGGNRGTDGASRQDLGRSKEEMAMPELATTEFWKELKPISKVFQPNALPEVYISNAPTDDERYYVPNVIKLEDVKVFIDQHGD